MGEVPKHDPQRVGTRPNFAANPSGVTTRSASVRARRNRVIIGGTSRAFWCASTCRRTICGTLAAATGCCIPGLDHGVGHPCSLWSIQRLVAADSEALVGEQRMPQSPQTSTAVSDGKTALRPSCRLRASEKSCEWPSDTHAFSGGLILAVDGSSVTGTRGVLPHWHWTAGTRPPALGPVGAAHFALPHSTWRTPHRAHTAACADAPPAPAGAGLPGPYACALRAPASTRE